MGQTKRECWQCDLCGHQWIKGTKLPRQCASPKCRSRRWNELNAQLSATHTAELSPLGAMHTCHIAEREVVYEEQ